MNTFVPVVIDVEASGFGPESYPIEIGVIFADGRKFCRLVKPEQNWTYWDSKAESLHRISRKILNSHGMSVKSMAEELNQQLDGMTVYSDCWTVDKPWIDLLFHAAKTTPRFQIRAIEMILDESQVVRWNDKHSDNLQKCLSDRHRASTDAELIQQTWIETRR